MFQPNLTGRLSSRVNRDQHGRITWGDQIVCPFAIVNLEISDEKTSVRADSSASRGAADERAAVRAVILIGLSPEPRIGDLFSFEGINYMINERHVRRSVTGVIDHYECGMEIKP
jgi:hypothetical protein